MISLVLKNPGLRKIAVIKAVRRLTGMNLKDAKATVDRAPVDLIPRCEKAPTIVEAIRVAGELRAEGAVVEGPGTMAEAMALMDESGRYLILGWNKGEDEKAWKEGIQLDDLFMEASELSGKLQWVHLRFVLPAILPDPVATGEIVSAAPKSNDRASLEIYLKSLGVAVECVQETCNNTDLIAVVESSRDLPPEAPLFWEGRVVKYQGRLNATPAEER